MGKRNRRPDLNGVLLIDKPLGWTSFDVVKKVRAATRGAKVGHAGTLDPLASGLLILCLGTATKRIESLMGSEKVYEGVVDLSGVTPTDDLESAVVPVEVERAPALDEIERVIGERFIGAIEQAPPAHSAILVDGKRAYSLARAGELTELPARTVVVHEIVVKGYEWPRLVLEVRCGKGTYLRSLARDLGRALGTGGYLAGLRRTRIGKYTVESAIGPEAVDVEGLGEERGIRDQGSEERGIRDQGSGISEEREH
ncbi:MAG: tRNA pseudouridine(55) synthase TruB [Phycisphaerales bacterium]